MLRSVISWQHQSQYQGLGCRTGHPAAARAACREAQKELACTHTFGWTQSNSHHLETMVETITFVGIYRGIIILGVLGWCRISSIHSRFGWLLKLISEASFVYIPRAKL